MCTPRQESPGQHHFEFQDSRQAEIQVLENPTCKPLARRLDKIFQTEVLVLAQLQHLLRWRSILKREFQNQSR